MKVMYPGTFDPITNGHIDIINRAVKVFDEVIVAVVRTSSKETLFSVDERIELVKKAIGNDVRVSVEPFDGLVVEFAQEKGVRTLLRGLRMISDFEYEFQMALTNRKINNSMETMFLMPREDYSYISSRLVKETFSLGADISHFAPPDIINALKKKLPIKK